MSDPSGIICTIRDSFSREEIKPAPLDTLKIEGQPLKTQILKAGQEDPPAVFVDLELYNQVADLKRQFDQFSGEKFTWARDQTNPAEYVGRSIFLNRAAIKIANIDAIFHLTGKPDGIEKMQFDDDFSFCDIASGPGGFTNYVQWRQTRSTGLGMTLRHPELDFQIESLDMDRFTALYGPDETGDLYTNWRWFSNEVIKVYPCGVDLVMADGGFEVPPEQANRQEWLNTRLLMAQILVGLKVTKNGGNFVLKVFDTVTKISADLLYILASSFKSITVFKPVSSRPANSERYVICQGRKSSSIVNPFYDQLKGVFSQMPVTQIFETLPPNFVQWLTVTNQRSLELQYHYCGLIIYFLNDSQEEAKEFMIHYNLRKLLLVWNLPGNIPPPERR